jgi:hypothetical protein
MYGGSQARRESVAYQNVGLDATESRYATVGIIGENEGAASETIEILAKKLVTRTLTPPFFWEINPQLAFGILIAGPVADRLEGEIEGGHFMVRVVRAQGLEAGNAAEVRDGHGLHGRAVPDVPLDRGSAS